MKQKISLAIFLIIFALISQMPGSAVSVQKAYSSNERLMSLRQMSLGKRYANEWVNGIFRDNILLALAYTNDKVSNPRNVDWDSVRDPFTFDITLNPGEVFAFHDDVLPEYRGKVVKTTGAHFNYSDGFKSDGYLYGDGVCHLASLINWAAKEAGLKVDSRVNHNFANIPEVPKVYGTSIVTTGQPSYNAEMQNLYVENNFDKPVRIVFNYDKDILTVSVYK